MSLRHAIAADLDTLVRIELRVSPSPWKRSHFQAALDSSSSQVLVTATEPICGFAVLSCAADETTLENIAVAPGAQCRGQGGELLHEVLELAAQQHSKRCLLEVRVGNTGAIALYRKYGFSDDGLRKGYYPKINGSREDALLMSRQLRESQ